MGLLCECCTEYIAEEHTSHALYPQDVGAMRFPLPKDGEIGPHLRLKELFDLLELPLFDYIYKTDDGLMYFNGVHSTIGDKEQRFKANELQVPDPYIAAGVDAICQDYITPLADLLLKDMETGSNKGWEKLKKEYDRISPELQRLQEKEAERRGRRRQSEGTGFPYTDAYERLSMTEWVLFVFHSLMP